VIDRELGILMGKEWRQLRRSRGALLSALVFPLLFLLVLPLGQMLALLAAPEAFRTEVGGLPVPPGLAALDDDPRALLQGLLLPLFVLISAVTVPGMTAIYTLISEREQRTIELLVALPVRVGQILAAKLLVLLLLAGGVLLGLFAVDAVVILALGIAPLGYVGALLLLLVTGLAYAIAVTLLLGLLARDARTANNLSGALLAPTIVLALAVLLSIPGTLRAVLALAALFTVGAVAVTVVALRVVTFERLVS
jgi:ABC-2 type transport system permease protein